MHPIIIAAAVIAINVAPTLGYVYSTQSICKTLLGSSSVSPVKTSSYVLTIPTTFTKKATVTPTYTITPSPVTTTTTVTAATTSTVLTTPTSTVTETDTETDTATATSTVVSTETDTTTTTTTPAATTVPTAAGFTPVASETSYQPKKRSENDAEAAVPAIRGRSGKTAPQKSLNKCPPPGSPGKFSPPVYPSSVVCGALVEAITTTTKTYTASTTQTTTIAPATTTATSTTTTTTTTTVTPTTVSVTSTTTTTTSTTTTTTTTSTTTTTTTSTVVAPTPTVYAACASNNVIGAANGNNGIRLIGYAGYAGVQITGVSSITDPVACCVQCQTTASCVGYAQYPGGSCFYFTNPSASCDGSQSFGDNFQTDTGVGAGQGYYVGNGNCGQFTDGGSDN